MMPFLASLENTSVGIWVRESGSMWSYPTILFLHTLGLALVVGMSIAISLRMLGVARRMPIGPLEHLYPIFWLGFLVNAASGVLLLIADATTKLMNPVFYVKIGSIVLAVAAMVAIRRVVFRDPERDTRTVPRGRWLAWAALTCWSAAILAGRLMAYLGPVSGAPGLENTFGQ